MGTNQSTTIDPDIQSAYQSGDPQTAPNQAQPLVTDDLRAAYQSADPTKANPATPQQLAVARAMGHPDMASQFNNLINNPQPTSDEVTGLKAIGAGLGAGNQWVEDKEARLANAFSGNPIPQDQMSKIKNLEFGDVQTAKGESPFNAAVQGTVTAGALNPLNLIAGPGEALSNGVEALAQGAGGAANAVRRALLLTAHTIGNRTTSEARNMLNNSYKYVTPDVTSADIPALSNAANKSQSLLTNLGNLKNQLYQQTKTTTANEVAQPHHVQQILNGVNQAAEGENASDVAGMMKEPIGMQDAPTINKDGSYTTTLYKQDNTAGGLVPYKQIVRTRGTSTAGDTTNLDSSTEHIDPSGVTTHNAQTSGSMVSGGIPNKIPYTVGDLFNDMTAGHRPTAQELNLAKQALNGHAPMGTPQSVVAGKMADAINEVLPQVSPSLANANAVNVEYNRAKDAMQTMFGNVSHDPLAGNQFSSLGKTLGIMRTPVGDPLVNAPRIFDEAITKGHALAGAKIPNSTLSEDIPGIAAAHTMGRWLPYLQGESLAGGALYAGKELAPGMEGFIKSAIPLVTLGGSPKIASSVGKLSYGQYGWQKALNNQVARAHAIAKTPMGSWITGAGSDMINKATRQSIMRQAGGENDQQ